MPEKRNLLSIASFISFSLGYAITSFISYFIPNWRWLLRAYGLIGIFYLMNFWLVAFIKIYKINSSKVKKK